MTQKELKALAREYAESTAIDIEECLLTEHGAFHAFQWFSERYEIVAKEKVKEVYKENVLRSTITPDSLKIEIIIGEARKTMLESLFPQTLKSEEK